MASRIVQHRESSAVSSCITSLQGIISKQHDKIFTDLLEFIRSAQQQLESLHLSSESEASHLLLPPRLEVPTAVLVAGVCVCVCVCTEGKFTTVVLL